jgi:protein involved in polysaccharide export with SLBB domain
MRFGRWRSLIWLALAATAMGGFLGCAANPKCLDQALLGNRNPAAHGTNVEDGYVVHCPDVLEVTVPGHPEWSGYRVVNADGRIALADHVFLRIDGKTAAEIGAIVEKLASAPAGVEVHVAEYQSQKLYLYSDVPGLQRAVPYQGPETIVDLLQRVGGISSRCAPNEIQVVRAHVADGRPTEVFKVDLAAILLKHDLRTNIQLQSFDQVYIGQSRQSAVLSCCPPWLQPLYKVLCGIGRRERASQQTKQLLSDRRPNGNSSL